MFYNFTNAGPAVSVATLHKQGRLLRNSPATGPEGLRELEQTKSHASIIREAETPQPSSGWTSLLSGFKWLTKSQCGLMLMNRAQKDATQLSCHRTLHLGLNQRHQCCNCNTVFATLAFNLWLLALGCSLLL